MFDFILQSAMVISLAAIIYLLARAVPRVRDEDLTVSNHSYFEEWLARIPVSKIDDWFGLLLAKFLRRLRVIVLKFDNLLHRSITSANNNHKHTEKETFINHLNGKKE